MNHPKKVTEVHALLDKVSASVVDSLGSNLDKIREKLAELEEELSSLKDTMVVAAHKHGMSPNDSQYCNAMSFLLKRVGQYNECTSLAKSQGYTSLESALRDLQPRVKPAGKDKVKEHYKRVLPDLLVELPLALKFSENLHHLSKIEALVVKHVYPVFEEYLALPDRDLEALIRKWETVEDEDGLCEIRNWCIARIEGFPEEKEDDVVPLDEVSERCLAGSSSLNHSIREELHRWVVKEGVSVPYREYNLSWRDVPIDRVPYRLLRMYAGCPLDPHVKQSFELMGLISPCFRGDLPDTITLEMLVTAMRTCETVKGTVKYHDDYYDAIKVALRDTASTITQLEPLEI